MIKLDIINEVVNKTGITKTKAELAVETVFESMKKALASGNRIELRGFGVFNVRPRKTGIGRNPRTGAEVSIPPGKSRALQAGQGIAVDRLSRVASALSCLALSRFGFVPGMFRCVFLRRSSIKEGSRVRVSTEESMSEPNSPIPTSTIEYYHALPKPQGRRPRERYWLHALLLVATCFTTLVVGARMEFNFLHNLPPFAAGDEWLPFFPLGWVHRQTVASAARHSFFGDAAGDFVRA